jgi:putative transposase
MALENPTWGQARVAAEPSVKLGIYVSPRTVRAYWPPESGPRGPHRTSSQHWKTFVRNHAQSIVACDFFVVVTARFRILYVFLLMDLGTRRILHCNLTTHPTAEWTLQQFRDAIPTDHAYRFLIRDRDSIFSAEVDDQLKTFGLSVVKDACSGTAGECVLRAVGRNGAARMPGFHDPTGRETPEQDPSGVDPSLQPRATPFKSGAGNS